MGKTTLFHPVSLNVIRGATEYCGFKLGKITQLGYNAQTNTGRYKAVLEVIPPQFADLSNEKLTRAFEGCFAADVTVSQIWFNREGKRVVHFYTKTAEVSDGTE